MLELSIYFYFFSLALINHLILCILCTICYKPNWNKSIIIIIIMVLHFSCYTSMTFLKMLSVILLSMLMILLSILSAIRHPICSNNLNWLLNLNLIYEALRTWVRSALLISVLANLSWLRLTGLITMVLLLWKWMDLFLRKNYPLRCWRWPSLLNWIGALTLPLLLKLPPRKLEL